MPPVIVHFDEATLQAMDRIAPVAKRQRTGFIQRAVRDAIRETERMQEAHRAQRDTPGFDVWELPEEW